MQRGLADDQFSNKDHVQVWILSAYGHLLYLDLRELQGSEELDHCQGDSVDEPRKQKVAISS